MERAAYIGCLDGDFDRVYIGEESCERLLPSVLGINERIESFKGKYGITLLTPILTDAGIVKIKDILDNVEGIDEIVVNDFGLLCELTKPIDVVLGRHLSRILIPQMLNGESQVYFANLLKRYNVKMIEIDGRDLKNLSALSDSRVSLVYPYATVSQTRRCSFLSKKSLRDSFPSCNRECVGNDYLVKHRWLKGKYMVKKNSLQLKMSLPKNLPSNVVRVVRNG